jgi:hypothetical protein
MSNYPPVLDPDFDDDGWKPAFAEPQLHPDYWGAHDYAGVLSGQSPCPGLSVPYRQWRAMKPKRLSWCVPEVIEVPDWRTPEVREPEPEPEVRLSRWPRNGSMPVLRADEDYEYLRVRYGQRFWTVIFGYLNGRIERWFRDDLDRIERCIVAEEPKRRT